MYDLSAQGPQLSDQLQEVGHKHLITSHFHRNESSYKVYIYDTEQTFED